VSILVKCVQQAVVVTAFVFVMMLLVEYLNVLTAGKWQWLISESRYLQYIIAGLLGVIPGCLGMFIVVALYSHGIVSIGAVVAAAVASSGDEAFIMLSVIPGSAFIIFGLLFVLGVLGGLLTDVVFGAKRTASPSEIPFELHEGEARNILAASQIAGYWRNLSLGRGAMTLLLLLCMIALSGKRIAMSEPTWIRISLFAVWGLGLFIVATVPEHFLQEHLWKHVALEHAPRVFLWTLGALIVIEIGVEHLNLEGIIEHNELLVLLTACLVGMIPESGPHVIFVFLFSEGRIPFSVLLASSVVQDGHGMLPLLAHSRRAFVFFKAINLVIGLAAGMIGFLLGY